MSVNNDSKLFDLDRPEVKEIWFLENTDRFGADPESYVETGFNLIFKDENDTLNLINPNVRSTFSFTQQFAL